MQKLQLSIPEPCHENWQNMQPTEQGRYCNACAKEVVDFSMMTDTEVLNYFTSITHEKVCGRTLPGQLERTISRPKDPKKRLFWYWNYIVMFFMFFSKANHVKAQGEVKAVTEISNVPAFKVGDTIISGSRVIRGKVTDIDSNPVSFATITIKKGCGGISADANGAYSIRVNSNDILIISGASFKTAEVPVGSQLFLNTVLEKRSNSLLGEVVVVTGGLSIDDLGYNSSRANPKYVASLQVKDDNSGLPIDKAMVSFTKISTKDADRAFTNKRGVYKLKRIKEYEEYNIKVEADGYESNEFTISGNDFNERKKIWEVLLRKQKVEVIKADAITKPGNEATITVRGQTIVTKEDKAAIYVVDGTIMSKAVDINPDDVEDYSILQAPQAMALFGPDGSNGAVIVTTRKPKVKNLDTVTVSATGYIKGRTMITCTSTVMGSMVKGVSVKSTIADSVRLIAAKINGAIKIYPNPVQRGDQINILLKLKQAGTHYIQIIDANGQIVLQKQINAVAKDHTEKIPVDNRWSSGVYYIRVFENNNKLISTNSFIVR